jgi:short-subunit dehydrogenase
MSMNAKKAIVIGASSGIGRALAKELAFRGYEVGIMARRLPLLRELEREINGKVYPRFIDLRSPDAAAGAFEALIGEMGGIDLAVINSGINHPNLGLDWALECETIQVNVAGFTVLADAAARYFLKRGQGHLVAVSSIAGIRGSARSPAYSASKAYVSIYLDGLRQRLCRTPVSVTDIRPGFVDTAMLEGRKNLPGMASAEEAARQICGAIEKKRFVAYVTRKWTWIALVMRLLPKRFYDWGYWRYIEADCRSKGILI